MEERMRKMERITDGQVQTYEMEHIETVRRMAAECTLLLRRDGTFPLEEPGKLALYGNGARHTIKGGTGSGDVNVRSFVTIEEGLKKAGFTITTGQWLDGYDAALAETRKAFIEGIKKEAAAAGVPAIMYGMGRICPEPEYELPLDGEGDTAVYVLARNSGEGSDRKIEPGDILLTKSEKRDILALNEKYDRFLLVLNVGGLVELAPVAEVKNILLLGQLGTPVGDVLADLVTGKAYPSGKLTMTWADIQAYPSTEGFGDLNDTGYKEDIYVGYRHFDKSEEAVAYPFGFGLSYTDFEIVPKDCELRSSLLTVSAAVKNTGSHAGKEVVQVYVGGPENMKNRPKKELRGYAKTKELAPGEETVVSIEIPLSTLMIYDNEDKKEKVKAGEYTVFCGSSVAKVSLAGRITVEEDVFAKPAGKKEENPKEIQELLDSLTEEELAYLCIGNYSEDAGQMSIIGAAAMKVAGAAGESTGRLESKGVAPVAFADGPAGIRISPSYWLEDGKAVASGAAFGADMMELLEKEQVAQLKAADKAHEGSEKYYQYCTAIPIGTDIAQSWNLEAAAACGELVGDEMERFGIRLWLAPALNIQRSPLCGRDFEYYSEDPLVSGKVAAAITKGVQSHPGCGVTIKHFAANNQETNRYVSNSIVSERALREIYLKGFEICVKEASPMAIMTSYNLINGEHSCSRRDLLTDILREEWGYEGIVMTDWYVTADFMKAPGSIHPSASAAGCVLAGNDLIMPGTPADLEDIKKALQDETHPYHLTIADLKTCAGRMLRFIQGGFKNAD